MSKLRSKSELNPERDKHDLEDGTLSSCSSTTQWMKVETRLIPVMCICVGDTPIGFGTIQSFESWQDLGNVKIGSKLGAHIFRSDYAIVTELTPK